MPAMPHVGKSTRVSPAVFGGLIEHGLSCGAQAAKTCMEEGERRESACAKGAARHAHSNYIRFILNQIALLFYFSSSAIFLAVFLHTINEFISLESC